MVRNDIFILHMPKKFLEGSKQTKPMRNRMADFAKSIESKLKPGAPWLYYSLRFVYRFFYPFASRAVFWSAYLYLSAEYLVLLVLNIGEIKNAEFICPRWFWNFGHQALEPHFLTTANGEGFLSANRNLRNRLTGFLEEAQ